MTTAGTVRALGLLSACLLAFGCGGAAHPSRTPLAESRTDPMARKRPSSARAPDAPTEEKPTPPEAPPPPPDDDDDDDDGDGAQAAWPRSAR